MSYYPSIILTSNYISEMDEESFFRFCQDNHPLRIERDSEKNILITAPASMTSGFVGSSINFQLSQWNDRNRKGVCFDTSTGFRLPDGSIRSRGVAWLSREKWETLSQEEKDKFGPVCPEFVVEIKSPSDNWDELKQKMTQVWMKNGSLLGFLIDPSKELSLVYKPGIEVRAFSFSQKLRGEEVLPGFKLDLSTASLQLQISF